MAPTYTCTSPSLLYTATFSPENVPLFPFPRPRRLINICKQTIMLIGRGNSAASLIAIAQRPHIDLARADYIHIILSRLFFQRKIPSCFEASMRHQLAFLHEIRFCFDESQKRQSLQKGNQPLSPLTKRIGHIQSRSICAKASL